MTALPMSLQKMFSEAKDILENREPSVDDSESDMEAEDEFLESLSRGEYTQEMYWRCQAEDCELEGDWNGALESYHRILEVEGEPAFTYWGAHNLLASLHDLLGNDNSALEHLQLATKLIQDDHDLLLSNSYVNETWQLLRMGQLAAVTNRLKEAHAILDPTGDFSEFHQADLLIAEAACSVASGKNRHAVKSLAKARKVLEALRDALIEDFPVEPHGVVAAYSSLWSVEAERCRLVHDYEGELQAWQQSLERARQFAADDPLSIVHAEHRVMRRLLSLGEACQRQGDPEESAKYFAEAESIRLRRKFPMLADRPFLPHSFATDKPLVLRLWNRCKSLISKGV